MTQQEQQLRALISRCKGVIVDAENAQLLLDEYLAFSNWDDTRDPINYKYNVIIEIVADAYCILNDYTNAFRIASEGIKKIEADYPEYAPNVKSRIYEILARCYAHQRDSASAVECFRKKAYFDIFHLNTSYPHFDLYSFRDVSEYSLADLRNLTVSLAPVSSFNDPVDTALFPWIDKMLDNPELTEEEKIYYQAMRQAYAGYKCRCFSANSPLPAWADGKKPPYDTVPPYLNTLMWAHYANYHKGFCVVYNIPASVTKANTKDASYIAVKDIKYIPSMPFNTDLSYEDAFFTKSNRWEYEHEVRLMYYKADDKREYPTVSFKDKPVKTHADGTNEYSLGSKEPQFPIKALYIGFRCSQEHQAELLDIMSKYPQVPVYKIKVSDSDIYSLDCELITGGMMTENKDDNATSTKCWICRFVDWIKTIIC